MMNSLPINLRNDTMISFFQAMKIRKSCQWNFGIWNLSRRWLGEVSQAVLKNLESVNTLKLTRTDQMSMCDNWYALRLLWSTEIKWWSSDKWHLYASRQWTTFSFQIIWCASSNLTPHWFTFWPREALLSSIVSIWTKDPCDTSSAPFWVRNKSVRVWPNLFSFTFSKRKIVLVVWTWTPVPLDNLRLTNLMWIRSFYREGDKR